MEETHIKSTKVSLKFANQGKQLIINSLIDEATRVTKQLIDIIWDMDKIPQWLNKSITSQIDDTWLSCDMVQSCAHQATSMVKATKRKQEKRLFIYNKLMTEGKHKQARKLKHKIDETKTSKPQVNNIKLTLNSHIVKQDWDTTTTFDGIITLTDIGNKIRLYIPVKKTKHFNKLQTQGKIKPGVFLSRNSITFCFEIPTKPKKQKGKTIGLDIGVKNVYTLSNGIASQPDNHGHTLDTINDKLTRKQKGSKAFLKTQHHRINYINWSINQINLKGISKVKAERIKGLRNNHKTSRKLSHFTYTEIFNKLEDLCMTNGVQIEYINPTYTSQRCSACGWVRSKNRKGKQFKCSSCGYEQDADLNAALNILANLLPISKKERLSHPNKKGFYWYEIGKKSIVSSTNKP